MWPREWPWRLSHPYPLPLLTPWPLGARLLLRESVLQLVPGRELGGAANLPPWFDYAYRTREGVRICVRRDRQTARWGTVRTTKAIGSSPSELGGGAQPWEWPEGVGWWELLPIDKHQQPTQPIWSFGLRALLLSRALLTAGEGSAQQVRDGGGDAHKKPRKGFPGNAISGFRTRGTLSIGC